MAIRKICHVIGSLRVGGAEKLFVQLLNAFENCDVAAIVLTTKENNSLEAEMREAIQIMYFPVRLLLSPLYILRLVYVFRKMKPDVVHAHMFWASFYAVIAAKLAGVPVILTSEHGLNPWKRKWHYFIERYLITPCVDLRICVSRDILENRITKDGINPEKLVFVPNGIRPNEYRARQFSMPYRLLAVGRLIEAKDYPTLIKAMKNLAERHLDFTLDILGDGELMADIVGEVHAAGLESRVFLRGTQSNVIDWMYEADMFVMSSIREGQPVSMLEAMSTGMPIVSTSVGGIPDTVEDGQEAMLVPPASPELLAEAIMKVFADKNLAERIGLGAYRRFNKCYSIASISDEIFSIYQRISLSKMSHV